MKRIPLAKFGTMCTSKRKKVRVKETCVIYETVMYQSPEFQKREKGLKAPLVSACLLFVCVFI